MVKSLGLSSVAYDWRAAHVPTFEEEIEQYEKHGIEFFAFWSWHDALEPLIKKHDIKPQIWITCPSPKQPHQDAKVRAAAQQLMTHVERTRRLGLKLGLYNHGGWGGEPENLVAVCKFLRRESDAEHVGIVYNFHHGHGHIDRFESVLKLMKPHLLCLNLNGMTDAALSTGPQKILPIGAGKHEAEMIRTVIASGYQGPVGILDHRNHLDARESLQQNLAGLAGLLEKL